MKFDLKYPYFLFSHYFSIFLYSAMPLLKTFLTRFLRKFIPISKYNRTLSKYFHHQNIHIQYLI